MTVRTPLLGCIGDDFTGSTDLANTLVRHGMRSVQLIGVPRQAEQTDADAVVIALKSRSIPARDAVAQSLDALAWLRDVGCRQFFFKYCSTFDSTDAGNIGPVADALLNALSADFTLACPAFPENGRSVYQGHLFVGDKLLNESGMEHHPLTPMTDANLVRVLARGSRGFAFAYWWVRHRNWTAGKFPPPQSVASERYGRCPTEGRWSIGGVVGQLFAGHSGSGAGNAQEPRRLQDRSAGTRQRQ
jgi:hypothetical protein